MTHSVGPPIKKESLQKMVYGRLHEAIVGGKIKPGTKVNVSELAGKLNVSVVPVREALIQLEAEGRVSFQPNKRIVINQLSEEEMNDIYLVMMPLEEIALEKCLINFDDAAYRKLKKILEEMERIGTSKEWINLNWHFHTSIHQISGSLKLLSILKSLRNNTIPYLHLSILDEERTQQANHEHCQLLDALKSKEIEKAKDILRKHLKNGQMAISRILRQYPNN